LVSKSKTFFGNKEEFIKPKLNSNVLIYRYINKNKDTKLFII
jgi:hypothetical protein